MKIGPYRFDSPLFLAPMAGVTDRPFRQLCRSLGADLTVSEMVAANPKLWETEKSRLRRDHAGEPEPRIVQIAGGDAEMLASAARKNVEHGAHIIDINMGCPAKKVCKKWAGSALLADEVLVEEILNAVVSAVDVPVTLKIRTGQVPESPNAMTVARIAEDAGIAMLSIHGRSRSQAYQGQAEYDCMAAVKHSVSIPVIANGDVDSPQKARYVLDYTKADGLMVGRAAQGNPWIFREIRHFLDTSELQPRPSRSEVRGVLLAHVKALHEFYGEGRGLRVARKHIGWYLKGRVEETIIKEKLMPIENAEEQLAVLAAAFELAEFEKAA